MAHGATRNNDQSAIHGSASHRIACGGASPVVVVVPCRSGLLVASVDRREFPCLPCGTTDGSTDRQRATDMPHVRAA